MKYMLYVDKFIHIYILRIFAKLYEKSYIMNFKKIKAKKLL